MTVSSKLTVFFEDPFWIGIFERQTDGYLEAAKVTFGPEPKDYEVYEFFLKHWSDLRFSPPVEAPVVERKQTPKRLRHSVRSQLSQTGIGTKAQQALKLQQELIAQLRKVVSREKAEQKNQKQFELRCQKRKEKKKGH